MSDYGKATVFNAENARCGLLSCPLCGAAILIDPRDTIDTVDLHTQFHLSQQTPPPVVRFDPQSMHGPDPAPGPDEALPDSSIR